MAHRNLYTSAVQEMDLAFGSKNPTDVSLLATLGEECQFCKNRNGIHFKLKLLEALYERVAK
ncbi:hypothetical protein C623_0204760 [Bacillus thuringiensis serovar aizawai str. Hu4-2]|nr:hypothetical protein C623_0204760 [Bacillus thuringiensis serovar aizawai str. Hu4-2]